MELTIRDPTDCGERCKCFTFQKRSLHLFSIIPCYWQTQFHKNKFALLTGIFWRKLLLKPRNAFTFCPLFKILVLRMVWLWCARNCHILWNAGPLLSGCPSTHRGRGSYCHFWRLYPGMSQWSESRFFIFEEWHLKKSSKQTIVTASRKSINFSMTRGRGSLCFEKFGEKYSKVSFLVVFFFCVCK